MSVFLLRGSVFDVDIYLYVYLFTNVFMGVYEIPQALISQNTEMSIQNFQCKMIMNNILTSSEHSYGTFVDFWNFLNSFLSEQKQKK